MFQRNNKIWKIDLVYKTSSFVSHQIKWHNKRISIKGFSIPRDFSCIENYKLLWRNMLCYRLKTCLSYAVKVRQLKPIVPFTFILISSNGPSLTSQYSRAILVGEDFFWSSFQFACSFLMWGEKKDWWKNGAKGKTYCGVWTSYWTALWELKLLSHQRHRRKRNRF